jgi:hypothetical protein
LELAAEWITGDTLGYLGPGCYLVVRGAYQARPIQARMIGLRNVQNDRSALSGWRRSLESVKGSPGSTRDCQL